MSTTTSRRTITLEFDGKTYEITPSFKVVDAIESAINLSFMYVPVIFSGSSFKLGQLARAGYGILSAHGKTTEKYGLEQIGEALVVGDNAINLRRCVVQIADHWLNNVKSLDEGGESEKKQEAEEVTP